jgi:3-methyladenine DNA glycosylase AlkD
MTDVQNTVASLKRTGRKSVRDSMRRYALPAEHAVGIPVGMLKQRAKAVGRDHDLARALWKTGIYEARLLAAFVGEPARVTPAEMDRWCKDFDSWGICDTVCFSLWDRTPHAMKKIRQWSTRREEFVKRAAFALLASAALHDKKMSDDAFAKGLSIIERGASDDRNFVKKGVSWALRLVGRRSQSLHQKSVELSRRLAASTDSTERWVGKDALRDLTRPMVTRRFSER